MGLRLMQELGGSRSVIWVAMVADLVEGGWRVRRGEAPLLVKICKIVSSVQSQTSHKRKQNEGRS